VNDAGVWLQKIPVAKIFAVEKIESVANKRISIANWDRC
jgi:hypothetical protein